MHAVVVSVTTMTSKAARPPAGPGRPRVSQAPGFVAGYWTRKGNSGLSMFVWESEDAANTANKMVRSVAPSPDRSTASRSISTQNATPPPPRPESPVSAGFVSCLPDLLASFLRGGGRLHQTGNDRIPGLLEARADVTRIMR